MTIKKIKEFINHNQYEFIHINSTQSTMISLKNFLNSKNKNCIVLSDQQTLGRGRRGNFWHSPKGNIYCSISFENLLDIRNHYLYSVLIAVSIKISLEKFNGKNIKFKWPNDIFYKNDKFGGIIIETHKVNEGSEYMIVGFGININSSPEIEEYPTTHVKNFCNIKNLIGFLLELYKNLFINLDLLENNNFNSIINLYKDSLMFLGESIKIKLSDNSIITGVFKDINNDGSMQLENDSKLLNIYNGSIKI